MEKMNVPILDSVADEMASNDEEIPVELYDAHQPVTFEFDQGGAFNVFGWIVFAGLYALSFFIAGFVFRGCL